MSYTTDEARAELRRLLPPGTTVRTILRHVSSSMMFRCISLAVSKRDGIHDITYLAARAVPGWKVSDRWGGIKVSGTGMDMGFSLVYTLSRTLYPDGFNCVEYKRGELVTWEDAADDYPVSPGGHPWPKPYRAIGEPKRAYREGYTPYEKRCPANDHMNYRDRSKVPYRHADGGYALRHNWL